MRWTRVPLENLIRMPKREPPPGIRPPLWGRIEALDWEKRFAQEMPELAEISWADFPVFALSELNELNVEGDDLIIEQIWPTSTL